MRSRLRGRSPGSRDVAVRALACLPVLIRLPEVVDVAFNRLRLVAGFGAHLVQRERDVGTLLQVLVHVDVLPLLVEGGAGGAHALVGHRVSLRVVEVAAPHLVLANRDGACVIAGGANEALLNGVVHHLAVGFDALVLGQPEEAVGGFLLRRVDVDHERFAVVLDGCHKRFVRIVVQRDVVAAVQLRVRLAVSIDGEHRLRIVYRQLKPRFRTLALGSVAVQPLLLHREVHQAQPAVVHRERLLAEGTVLVGVVRDLVHVVVGGNALTIGVGPPFVDPALVPKLCALGLGFEVHGVFGLAVEGFQARLLHDDVSRGQAIHRNGELQEPAVGLGKRQTLEDDIALLVLERSIDCRVQVVLRAHVDEAGQAVGRVLAVRPVLHEVEIGALAGPVAVGDGGEVLLGIVTALAVPTGGLHLHHAVQVARARLRVQRKPRDLKIIGVRLLRARHGVAGIALQAVIEAACLVVCLAVQHELAHQRGALVHAHGHLVLARRVGLRGKPLVIVGRGLLPQFLHVLVGGVVERVDDGAGAGINLRRELHLHGFVAGPFERLQAQRERGGAVAVAREVRFGAVLRDVRLDPAILQLVAVLVVFGIRPRYLLREHFGIEAAQVLRDGGALGVLRVRPLAVRPYAALLQRERAGHVFQLVLERRHRPRLDLRNRLGARQMVLHGAAVVGEAIGVGARPQGAHRRAGVAVLVGVENLRLPIRVVVIGRGVVEQHLIVRQGRVLAHAVHEGVAVRIVLVQFKVGVLLPEQISEVHGAVVGRIVGIDGDGDEAAVCRAHLRGVGDAAGRGAVRVAPQRERHVAALALVVAVAPLFCGAERGGAHVREHDGSARIGVIHHRAVVGGRRVVVGGLVVVVILVIALVDQTVLDRPAVHRVLGQIGEQGHGVGVFVELPVPTERAAEALLLFERSGVGALLHEVFKGVCALHLVVHHHFNADEVVFVPQANKGFVTHLARDGEPHLRQKLEVLRALRGRGVAAVIFVVGGVGKRPFHRVGGFRRLVDRLARARLVQQVAIIVPRLRPGGLYHLCRQAGRHGEVGSHSRLLRGHGGSVCHTKVEAHVLGGGRDAFRRRAVRRADEAALPHGRDSSLLVADRESQGRFHVSGLGAACVVVVGPVGGEGLALGCSAGNPGGIGRGGAGGEGVRRGRGGRVVFGFVVGFATGLVAGLRIALRLSPQGQKLGRRGNFQLNRALLAVLGGLHDPFDQRAFVGCQSRVHRHVKRQMRGERPVRSKLHAQHAVLDGSKGRLGCGVVRRGFGVVSRGRRVASRGSGVVRRGCEIISWGCGAVRRGFGVVRRSRGHGALAACVRAAFGQRDGKPVARKHGVVFFGGSKLERDVERSGNGSRKPVVGSVCGALRQDGEGGIKDEVVKGGRPVLRVARLGVRRAVVRGRFACRGIAK